MIKYRFLVGFIMVLAITNVSGQRFSIYALSGISNTNDDFRKNERRNLPRFSFEYSTNLLFPTGNYFGLKTGMGISQFNHFSDFSPIINEYYYQENSFTLQRTFGDVHFGCFLKYKKFKSYFSIIGAYVLRGMIYSNLFVQDANTGKVVVDDKNVESVLIQDPLFVGFFSTQLAYSLHPKLHLLMGYRKSFTPIFSNTWGNKLIYVHNFTMGLEYSFGKGKWKR